jgi:hypothetical protein
MRATARRRARCLAWIAERDARDPGTLGGALAVAWALHDVSVAGTIAGRVAAALERLHDPRTAVDGDAIF